MKKSLVMMMLVLASAALVQQSLAQAAGQPSGQQSTQAKGPEIKDPAEYNAYVNAYQQQNPGQKAVALEAFLQTYPNSVMKETALELLMGAYQQANNAQKMVDAANRLLQVNPNNVRALALLSAYNRQMALQGGPQAAQSVAQAEQYGQQGLQALQTMKKPEGMSDADFTKLHNDFTAIFDGAVAFADLQKKDYATAAKDYREAVGDETQPDLVDVYQLATADLEGKPINPEGFWFVVKAAMLAQGTGQQQILDYGKKKYIRYHNSDQGWDDIVAQAKASTSILPPAGFTVTQYIPPSPAQQAADLVQKTNPTQMSFAEWELVLSSGNQQAADTVWNAIKGKAVKLGANVIGGTSSSVQLAGSDDDIEAKKADITLSMTKPIPPRLMPSVGTLMTFQGTVSSYTPNPFMLTMTDGVLLDKNGNPLSTAPPVRHTTPHKSE